MSNSTTEETKKLGKDMTELIDRLYESLTVLGEKSDEFVSAYDTYISTKNKDGAIIKNKLKAMVVQVINDDIK